MFHVDFFTPIINPKPQSTLYCLGEKADSYLSYSKEKVRWGADIADWKYEICKRKGISSTTKVALAIITLGLLPLISLGVKYLYRKNLFRHLNIGNKACPLESAATLSAQQARKHLIADRRYASLHWYLKSHDLGNIKATKKLAELYEKNHFHEPEEHSLNMADNYYRQAAEKEDGYAMFWLARKCLLRKERQAEGFEWAEKSAKTYKPGLKLLGEAYLGGLGTERNLIRASVIFQYLMIEYQNKSLHDRSDSYKQSQEQVKQLEEIDQRESQLETEKNWLIKFLNISKEDLEKSNDALEDRYVKIDQTIQKTSDLIKEISHRLDKMTGNKS